MSFLQPIISALPLAFAYCCLATVAFQAAAGAALWSNGKLSKPKLVRYAAIAYGLDVAELPGEKSPAPDPDSAESEEGLTYEQLLAKRANANPILVERKNAMRQEADIIRTIEKDLKSERDRRALVRKNFRTYLDKLEKEVVMASLGDVQRTLENISSRQAKDIILRTFDDEGLDDGDDVIGDIVTIIKAMPEGKLKKILGEFKTDAEQAKLHRIMMEISGLNEEATP